MGGLIHVGANDGREYADVQDQRLLLIEPQAGAFRALEENCPHADLVHAACGAGPGMATIHTSEPSHSSSLLSCTGSVFTGTETVQVATLDAIVDGRDGFDALRIDTQGYELEVLKGAQQTLLSVSRVELEVHDPSTYAGAATLTELDGHLAVAGFTRVTPDGELAEVIYEKEQT